MVLVESGAGPGEGVPFVRADSRVGFARVDPATGVVDCKFKSADASGVGKRILRPHPDSALIATGTDVGRLTGLGDEGCVLAWSTTPLETGSRLQFQVTPGPAVIEGPHVVRVTVTVHLEGLGDVELYWIGHVVLAGAPIPVWIVYMRAHLHLWF